MAPVLTIKEACQLARCGKNTIYSALQAGALAGRKLGKKTLIMRVELIAWLEGLPRYQSEIPVDADEAAPAPPEKPERPRKVRLVPRAA